MAPLFADVLLMRPALFLKASTARSTVICIRSGDSSRVDAASIAARHRSDSVNATSIEEQSLSHRQRLPAVGTTHQRLLQLTDLRDYDCNGAKTLHPRFTDRARRWSFSGTKKRSDRLTQTLV
jgi:hypothetical protein